MTHQNITEHYVHVDAELLLYNTYIIIIMFNAKCGSFQNY